MNGRIYDPLFGRFLSADLEVQLPGSLQSYNRYSYVMNNPLSLTDPSGFLAASPTVAAPPPAAPPPYIKVPPRVVIPPSVGPKAPVIGLPGIIAIAILGGLEAYDEYQANKATIAREEESLKRSGQPLTNKPNQAPPHEVKLDPETIQANQKDQVKTNQSPPAETKPDAPKEESKKDDAKSSSEGKDSKQDSSKVASSAVNGNSSKSEKGQQGYVIVDTQNDDAVVKNGISGQKPNTDGSSPRANSQANKWNKEEGTPGRYEPKIVFDVAPGPGAREAAKKAEEQVSEQNRDTLDPNKHQRP